MINREFVRDNNVFIRSGECLRCGKCCYAYDRVEEPREIIPCKDLSYDEKGIASCGREGINKPQICIECPIYPHQCTFNEAIAGCGYTWTVNPALSKTEALEKFNRICDLCDRKPCPYFNDLIGEINTLTDVSP